MEIRTIAFELNRRCRNYKMDSFQEIRRKIHNLKRTNPNKIFSDQSIKDHYAFHIGGRKELQYNIGFEKINEKDYLRYGVAFSLESARNLPIDKIDEIFLSPPPYPNRIERYNDFLESQYVKYLPDNLKIFFHLDGRRKAIEDIHKINIEDIREIINTNNTIKYFYFIGKSMLLDSINYAEILSTFDKLLPLYIYVEGGKIRDFIKLSDLEGETPLPPDDDEFDPLTVDTSFPSDIDEAEEGRRILKQHYVRERNPFIIRMAKKRKMDQYGELRCEVCNFLFFDVYGDHGKGFIEGHHIKPISEMMPGDKTNIEDIALLCSNCHRMIHKNMETLTIEELKNMIRYKWE